jgi:hypothetical protein
MWHRVLFTAHRSLGNLIGGGVRSGQVDRRRNEVGWSKYVLPARQTGNASSLASVRVAQR